MKRIENAGDFSGNADDAVEGLKRLPIEVALAKFVDCPAPAGFVPNPVIAQQLHTTTEWAVDDQALDEFRAVLFGDGYALIAIVAWLGKLVSGSKLGNRLRLK